MTQGARRATAMAASLMAGLLASPAHADRSWVYGGDAVGGMLLSEPQKSLFGPGGSISLSGYQSFSPKLLLGLRLRMAAFLDGTAPNVSRANPDKGGFGALLAAARYRPKGRDRAGRPFDRMSGIWVEGSAGAGITGTLPRPMVDLGLGYGMIYQHTVVSPVLRYIHIVQPGTGRDGQDAMMAMVGIEALWGTNPAPVVEEPEEAETPAAPDAKAGDKDGDGIADAIDKCPTEKEDRDGFEDGDGCPDLDNDRDGIPDDRDACPLQAEVINGINDGDGCPDQGIITMVDDRVVLSEHVLFETDRARVSTEGRTALVAVLRLWTQHPEWQRLDVEGHADERGSDAYNQWLSEERAARVHKALLELGLAPDKVTSRGFGKTRPRAQGRDEESLRLNRRVELVVIRQAGPVPASPPQVAPPPGAPGLPPPALHPPPAMPLSPPPADGGGFAPSLPVAPPAHSPGPAPAAAPVPPSAPPQRPPRRVRRPPNQAPDDERR